MNDVFLRLFVEETRFLRLKMSASFVCWPIPPGIYFNRSSIVIVWYVNVRCNWFIMGTIRISIRNTVHDLTNIKWFGQFNFISALQPEICLNPLPFKVWQVSVYGWFCFSFEISYFFSSFHCWFQHCLHILQYVVLITTGFMSAVSAGVLYYHCFWFLTFSVKS